MTTRYVLTEWLSQTDQTNFKEGHYFVIEEAMKEYAKLKCQELLEIVAEKASKLPATIYIKPNTPHYARLGKDSILNVVDLDSFCF